MPPSARKRVHRICSLKYLSHIAITTRVAHTSTRIRTRIADTTSFANFIYSSSVPSMSSRMRVWFFKSSSNTCSHNAKS